MRISDQMFFQSVMVQLQRQTDSLFHLQEQVSSGKRINRPSDDPIGQPLVLNYGKTLATTEQYLRNIDRGDSLMTHSESILQDASDQLQRAHELAIQMANATYSPTDRANTAREIREIFDQLIAMGNRSVEGRYLFAGDQTTTIPFVDHGYYTGTAVALPVTITAGVNDQLTLSLDGISSTVTIPAGNYASGNALAVAVQTAINADPTLAAAGGSVTATFDTDHLVLTSNATGGTSAVLPTGGTAQNVLGLAAGTNRPVGTYLGDSREASLLIGPNTPVIVSLPGDRLFKGVGVTGGVDIFSSVAGLQVALETNDMAGIQAALTNIGAAQEQVNNERVLLGARLNRMDATKTVLSDFKLSITQFKSNIENVDLTEVISEFSLQQTALEATRATAARLVQHSLLDFLK
ncbi:MAG: flagellar hook-associated protein 3 [Candidatus Manganitrophaceae bacterium]|nr:MAG: flagellar hook-associated protein 3 [Candidatus Manganitrophaceae bacterium]